MEKVTIPKLVKMKRERKKITMITAYDYPTAMISDAVGVDIILVGDSVGMVMLGYSSTLPVTMDEMLHHCRAVVRGTKQSLRARILCKILKNCSARQYKNDV